MIKERNGMRNFEYSGRIFDEVITTQNKVSTRVQMEFSFIDGRNIDGKWTSKFGRLSDDCWNTIKGYMFGGDEGRGWGPGRVWAVKWSDGWRLMASDRVHISTVIICTLPECDANEIMNVTL